jgi:transcriptional regulator with XRE-family HTH domain
VQLAALSHIAQNSISKLERGIHRRPAFETTLALARALRINPALLRFGLDPEERGQADGRRKPLTGTTAARVTP